MNFQRSTKIKRSSDRPRALIIGLLISLLLHLLVVLFFFLFPQQEQLEPKRQEPTIVRLIDLPAEIEKPQPEEKSTFEIDQQPVTPPPTTPVESSRKAERDQKVDQEQAPEADDVRDQTTKPPETKLPPQQIQKPEKKPIPPPKEEIIKPQPKAPEQTPKPPESKSPPLKKPLSVDKDGQEKKQKTEREATQPKKEQPVTAPSIPPAEQQKSPVPPLTLEQLLPSPQTLDQLARGSLSNRNRSKERENVKIGDEVWLNLQQNFLASFFRRLHDKIDLVWNYPPQARRERTQGTLELLIIVDKKGKLVDVDLVRSSGSDILDYEAIQAIYRASPFGPLPKRYPHDVLKIHANFRYRLGSKAMFGR